MPEVGNMPLPRKLLERGIRDMLRISDARMSGTAFGTVVLHVAPEAEAGGPLASFKTVMRFSSMDRNASSNLLVSAGGARAARGKRGARDAPHRSTRAVTTVCTSNMCCRRIRGAIWIS